MKHNKVTRHQTYRYLKVWWLLLSGTTSKILTVLGLGVLMFLVAVGTGTGTSTTTVNADQLKSETNTPDKRVPSLTLISNDATGKLIPTDDNFVEILASKKDQTTDLLALKEVVSSSTKTHFVIAQSNTQSELQKLVDQAMNQEASTAVVAVPTASSEPVGNSTNDQLKALINQANPSGNTPTTNSYISTLNAEVETTVVIDEKTAQQPATNASLSNSERLKLIQDIAKKVADDNNETIESVEYVTVQENDSLWVIAKRVYDDAYQYELLYQANRDILLNKNSLVVGQQLRVPKLN